MIQATKGREAMTVVPSATSAARSAAIDTIGADFATIRMLFSSGLTTDAVAPVISLLEDDTTVVTDHATFDANFETTAVLATAATMTVFHVDLKTRKRYLRLTITPGTVASDDAVAIGVATTLTRLEEAPASTTDMVSNTNHIVVLG